MPTTRIGLRQYRRRRRVDHQRSNHETAKTRTDQRPTAAHCYGADIESKWDGERLLGRQLVPYSALHSSARQGLLNDSLSSITPLSDRGIPKLKRRTVISKPDSSSITRPSEIIGRSRLLSALIGKCSLRNPSPLRTPRNELGWIGNEPFRGGDSRSIPPRYWHRSA